MTEHRIAYLMKNSRILAALEERLLASPLTHEQKLAALAAYERLHRRLLEGHVPNKHWVVSIFEAAGLRNVRIEINGSVTATIADGDSLNLLIPA
jgi:hypothetical protein